jgi:hypothetical protein
MLESCKSGSDTAIRVPYQEVRNYFFNNNAIAPKNPLITTSQQFDDLFGMAAYMGKDGMPTTIDFAKQSVIAVVIPETSMVTTIKPLQLISKGTQLQFSYQVIIGEQVSYTMRPIYLLMVDNKYVQGKTITLMADSIYK